ncbi:MAG: hypothetical protein JSS09_05040 [Verrucomicrobia bacterium]|nr:hypothetical protein [Verrucomicrobiota bacterium]
MGWVLADLLRTKVGHLSPLRAKLVKKGMIYSLSHGKIVLAVPSFDEFMKRVMPNLS